MKSSIRQIFGELQGQNEYGGGGERRKAFFVYADALLSIPFDKRYTTS